MANGIEDATKHQAILLSVCGPSTYQLIRDLLSPTKPTDKSFAELVTLVKEHQQLAPSFIVQHYNFNTRVQQPGETISAFVAQLRKIARDCLYGETLEDMLRDRLVCGCRDHRLQCKLLADPALTFEKAMTIAKSNETAEQGARDLAGRRSASIQLQPVAQPATARASPTYSPTSDTPLLSLWCIAFTIHLQVQDHHLPLLREDWSPCIRLPQEGPCLLSLWCIAFTIHLQVQDHHLPLLREDWSPCIRLPQEGP